MGANGEYITVFPAADAVIVHKVDIDIDETPQVNPVEYATVLEMLIAAGCEGPCPAL